MRAMSRLVQVSRLQPERRLDFGVHGARPRCVVVLVARVGENDNRRVGRRVIIQQGIGTGVFVAAGEDSDGASLGASYEPTQSALTFLDRDHRRKERVDRRRG